LGEAYIFDSGDDSSKPVWEHAAIETETSRDGHDWYAQHSYNYEKDWRTWYFKRTTSQRRNMEKAGHGIRIIRP